MHGGAGGGVLGRLVGEGGNGDGPGLAAGVDADLGRDGVAAVGDQSQVEVVEGHGPAELDVEVLAGGVADLGAPRGGRVTVERRGRASERGGREVLRRVGGDATGGRARDPEGLVDD